MGLSNTATPRYYGEFRAKVISGEIPVNNEISMEMNRIDAMIADPRYYYDDQAIEGFIRFCENELTLTDGGDLHLLDSFKLWSEQIFGWYRFVTKQVYVPKRNGKGGHFVKKRVKLRVTKKQFLIIARGAAKSLYISCIQQYFLVIDPTTTQQITTAPTMKQAEEVLTPIRTALARARGPLFQLLTDKVFATSKGSSAARSKLLSTKKGIENLLTGSVLEIRPMSVTKLQGLRSQYNSVDEWLSGDIREDVIGALEQGASKYDEYLVLCVSSEGTVRNGAGDTIKMELLDILKGDLYQPHTSIFYYKLDTLQEVGDPSMWVKANPNLGYTVSYETYHSDVSRAEASLAARNDILAKRFGIPMEGLSYFFTYEETKTHPPKQYWRMPCAMGMDLSQGDDFCAFTFLFPLNGGRFGVKTRSYITERTLLKLSGAMRVKYEEFIREGSLSIMPGSILDMMMVYEDIEAFIDENQYDIRSLGYDPYNALSFITRWEKENGPYGIVKVNQGAKTESVPLGEIKKLSEDRVLFFDELLMSFAMGNAVTLEDTNGNRKLLKKRHDEKIDNVAALMDAWVAYQVNKDAFE